MDEYDVRIERLEKMGGPPQKRIQSQAYEQQSVFIGVKDTPRCPGVKWQQCNNVPGRSHFCEILFESETLGRSLPRRVRDQENDSFHFNGIIIILQI